MQRQDVARWCSKWVWLIGSAEAGILPDYISTKKDFYEHVGSQIASIVDGQHNWVTNLANVSSVLYHSMNAFAAWKHKPVNWAGFYLMSPLFPGGGLADVQQPTLWLGPFCGMPACQIIASVPGKGVCADASAILPPKPICVGRTDEYPGHIACDSQSQSEIVVPMMVSRNKLSAKCQDALNGIGPPELIRAWAGRGDQEEIIVGVLDIDCTQPNGFDQEDIDALQDLTRKVTSACDWLV